MSGPFSCGDVMRTLQLFPYVIGLLCSPLAAQQRHTITHEDVFLMKRVGSPAISPDGRWIVFSVTEPSYAEGEQVSDLWLVERRPHLFVQALDPGAQAKDLLAGSQLVQGAGFGGQLGTSGEDLAAAWTPDGSGVVFAATTNRGDWTHGDVVQALWLVAATGGEPQRLTQGKDDYDGPQFSPDGKTLYAVMTPTNEHTFNNRRVVAWSWPRTAAAAPRAVTGGADHSVGSYTIAPDNRAVFFLAEDAGHQRLFDA